MTLDSEIQFFDKENSINDFFFPFPSAFYQRKITLHPPKKYVTPYGGRLEWELPGENKLIVHLKDKDKIRHKKRWSQVIHGHDSSLTLERPTYEVNSMLQCI